MKVRRWRSSARLWECVCLSTNRYLWNVLWLLWWNQHVSSYSCSRQNAVKISADDGPFQKHVHTRISAGNSAKFGARQPGSFRTTATEIPDRCQAIPVPRMTRIWCSGALFLKLVQPVSGRVLSRLLPHRCALTLNSKSRINLQMVDNTINCLYTYRIFNSKNRACMLQDHLQINLHSNDTYIHA